MNKEEILARSRRENKNRDAYEQEVLKEGGSAGAIAAALLATIFFCIPIFVGGGMNYALYAVVFAIPATGFTVKAIRMKRRHEIALSVLYWVAVAGLSAAHIYQLVATSAIL